MASIALVGGDLLQKARHSLERSIAELESEARQTRSVLHVNLIPFRSRLAEIHIWESLGGLVSLEGEWDDERWETARRRAQKARHLSELTGLETLRRRALFAETLLLKASVANAVGVHRVLKTFQDARAMLESLASIWKPFTEVSHPVDFAACCLQAVQIFGALERTLEAVPPDAAGVARKAWRRTLGSLPSFAALDDFLPLPIVLKAVSLDTLVLACMRYSQSSADARHGKPQLPLLMLLPTDSIFEGFPFETIVGRDLSATTTSLSGRAKEGIEQVLEVLTSSTKAQTMDLLKLLSRDVKVAKHTLGSAMKNSVKTDDSVFIDPIAGGVVESLARCRAQASAGSKGTVDQGFSALEPVLEKLKLFYRGILEEENQQKGNQSRPPLRIAAAFRRF